MPRVLQPSTENDRFFDYCLHPYEPRRSSVGKLRAENILWNSFDVAQLDPLLESAVRSASQSVGRDMTVWGIKYDRRQLFWEFYFYDPKEYAPRVTVSAMRETLFPYLAMDAHVPETIPYIMFSFDLFPWTAETKCIDSLNLYLGSAHTQGTGRSYVVTGDRMELRNIYRALHPTLEIEKVLFNIRSSVFIDFTMVPLSRVLLPELFSCRQICVTKKPTTDGIYYSGVDVNQLLWFLKYFEYPSSLTAFVESHWQGFEHLFFDIGIDYAMDACGRLVMTKSSFYGTV